MAARTRTVTVPSTGRARLFVTYVDVWSVAKMAFLLAFFASIVTFGVFTALWWVFDSLRVASSVEDTLNTVIGSESFTVSVSPYVAYSALAAPVGVGIATCAAVALLLAVICAAVYNVGVKIFGGVELTVSDRPTTT